MGNDTVALGVMIVVMIAASAFFILQVLPYVG